MVMTAAGLLLVVLSVEMHPDFLSMELGMLIGIIGICLVYIPLINERKECDDCRYKREYIKDIKKLDKLTQEMKKL